MRTAAPPALVGARVGMLNSVGRREGAAERCQAGQAGTADGWVGHHGGLLPSCQQLHPVVLHKAGGGRGRLSGDFAGQQREDLPRSQDNLCAAEVTDCRTLLGGIRLQHFLRREAWVCGGRGGEFDVTDQEAYMLFGVPVCGRVWSSRSPSCRVSDISEMVVYVCGGVGLSEARFET
jgi:hypothetical protein